jgi:CRP/FNR family transcriptional regulator, cyclic AMP receptor protein
MMKRAADTWFENEDPLTYLPRKPLQEYAKDRIIYGPQQPCGHLYVVIQGRVKLTSAADDGCQIIARIVPPEGLFGESALIYSKTGVETATTLESVTLMAWSGQEIERHIEREPRLGVALTQYMVRQCLDLQDRIESMAVYKTPERVVLALIQLAESLGTALPDGSMRLASLTHHSIAEFVGTSREIVTFQMNRLRRMGMVKYTRRHIDVYSQALSEHLRQQGIATPRSATSYMRMAG